ncbi:hypothetical protein [Methanobrevibacter sp.]|uniref:hypothetical protein n=1 Tax=Methanobrevibacter sp. TaxID=66852 RepID=UPI002E776870|nr:hypothetical protein [Methanobrevibacter sp.]MEE1335367.1 hypothetical protein [Methanobrevibacter sp.]
MKYKKGVIFICLIICLFSIASVCASDINETLVASENQNDEIIDVENQNVNVVDNELNNDEFNEVNSVAKDDINVSDDLDEYDDILCFSNDENVLDASPKFNDYTVDVSDTYSCFGIYKEITMSITYNKYNTYTHDFYFKVYDSYGIEKISQRYYSGQVYSSVKYNLGRHELDPGIYTIKIVNYADNHVMDTAKLTVKERTIEASDLITNYKDIIVYTVRLGYGYDTFWAGQEVTFDICDEWYKSKTDENGYATLKIHLKAGSYSIITHYDDFDSMVEHTITINPIYMSNDYKNFYIKPTTAYYGQDKELNCGWTGFFEGYLKVYKGNKLQYIQEIGNPTYVYNYVKYTKHYIGDEFTTDRLLSVGIYTAKIFDMKGKIVAQSKIKIIKTPTKIKIKSIKAKPNSKIYVKAKVYEKYSGEGAWTGKVKFKIMGKTYKVKVKEGIAKIKIKIPSKIKTYRCKVKFLGNKDAKKSSAKFKIKVLRPHANKKINNGKHSSSKYKIITTTAKYHWITKKSGKFTVKTIIWDMTAGFRASGKYIDTTLYKNGRQVYNSKYSVKYKINGRWTGWAKYGTTSTAHHRYFVWDSDYVGKIKVKVKRNVNSYL